MTEYTHCMKCKKPFKIAQVLPLCNNCEEEFFSILNMLVPNPYAESAVDDVITSLLGGSHESDKTRGEKNP